MCFYCYWLAHPGSAFLCVRKFLGKSGYCCPGPGQRNRNRLKFRQKNVKKVTEGQTPKFWEAGRLPKEATPLPSLEISEEEPELWELAPSLGTPACAAWRNCLGRGVHRAAKDRESCSRERWGIPPLRRKRAAHWGSPITRVGGDGGSYLGPSHSWFGNSWDYGSKNQSNYFSWTVFTFI